MKFWKSIFLSAAAFVAVATTVTFTSCEKDSCTDLKCKNGGACSEGFCRCKTGYEGAECELKISDRFLGTYVGYNHCNGDPALVDTVDVYFEREPNVLSLYRRANPGTVMTGTASGYEILIDDVTSGSNRRHVTVVLDTKEITVHVENYTGSTSLVCNFIGSKK